MNETMRTKRRYAHELYPHPAGDEVRPLATDVPYLYARAIGLEVQGTGWFDRDEEGLRRSSDRTQILISARERALIADALLQGMAGFEAWEWAELRAHEESGEWIGERAEVYGVEWDAIKPYPCGPEPDHHDHREPIDGSKWKTVIRVDGRESACADCCFDPEPAAAASLVVVDGEQR